MCHLDDRFAADDVAIEREEAPAAERIEDLVEAIGAGPDRAKLRAGDPAGSRLARWGRHHEAQKDLPGDRPALLAEGQVRLLGSSPERTEHAADGLVARTGQLPPACAFEQIGQGVLEERKATWPPDDVGDDLAGQTRLQRRPDRRGGALDCALQLIAGQRSDELRARPYQLAELPGAEQAVEVVGAHGGDDQKPAGAGRKARRERREEAGPLRLVGAEGNELFELVDHEEQARRSFRERESERAARVVALFERGCRAA